MLKLRKQIKGLVIDALMIAMFVVLSKFFSISLGNVKITLAALPIAFTALYLGMTHVIVVAAIGEFISQMIGYGLTYTTPLWIIPVVVRGILICLFASFIIKRRGGDVRNIKYYEYFIILIISGAVVTVLNTAVIALDAVIFGYYSYAYVFGDLAFRFISMIASTVVYTAVTKTVIDALYRIRL